MRLTNLTVVLNIRDGLKSGKPLITALFRVDTDSQRHGGELVAEVLKAHSVREIFTLCGGHISPILVACEQLGIRVLDTRHEATAVFAADAAARLRQDIGVAAVTAGPGITNTVTALKNAQMAESPVLLLGGASPSLLKGRGALQDIDQQTLLRSLCKFTARVTCVRNIVPTIRKAIAIAKSDTPGPVFVELPIDVLYPFKTVEREAGLSKEPKGVVKKMLDFFVRLHIASTFSDAWQPQPLLPLPVHIPRPSSAQIERMAELVRLAKRPLLLIGSQAMAPPVKASELAQTIEALCIPVYLGGMSRGLLGVNSAIQMRQERREALRDADLVILAGAVCDFRLGYGRVLSPNCKVITINRSKEQMLKNHGVFWRSVLAVQADVASTLVQLHQRLGLSSDASSDAWLGALRLRDAEKEARNAAKAAGQTADGRLNPLRAAYIVHPRGPLQWLDPGAFGTLGVGAGFALGAKAVHPDSPVLILYGDGACGFSLMDFDSFVRHRLPVVALIGNDACWAQIARDQVPWFNSSVGCELSYTSYDEVGRGLGARGVQLKEPTEESEVRHQLGLALAKCLEGQSTVINALIGRTNFREGSISV
uniref:2-hydroxyacyl-CoA lyase 2 n=1 Tax=Globodera pallida TaxID=36090 RepID=A0A183BVC6_GLOPA